MGSARDKRLSRKYENRVGVRRVPTLKPRDMAARGRTPRTGAYVFGQTTPSGRKCTFPVPSCSQIS